MSKDTKIILKEMREDIKAERFEEAINKGNNLLEVEPRSYMCHLLMGAAFQNTNKAEATKHLHQAIDCCGNNPPTIALQGLANCAPTHELPGIYKELLRLVPDKYAEFYEKIFRVAEHTNFTNECFILFCIEADEVTENAERRSLLLCYLAKLWILYDIEVNRANENLYKSALETITSSDDKKNVKLIPNAYKRYLKLLYNRKEYENCLKYASNVLYFYPDAIYALEWICKIYCEHYGSQEGAKYFSILNNPIQHYATSLLDLNENSGLALLVKAIDLYVAEQYVSSHDLLKKVQLVQPNYRVALELLARTEMKLDAYEMALPYWQLLEKTESIEYTICLSHCMQEKQFIEAINILEEMKQTSDVIATLARCYYKLHDLEKLKLLKLDIKSQAEFLMEPNEAISALQSSADVDVETFETLFLLGKLSLKKGAYQDALTYILKATRLQPYHSMCFYHLGCIYYATRDIVRARKCFEKCVHMNPACFDAVYNLSAIYQEIKEENSNMALLLNALDYMKFENSQRIHYKLGLHYLSSNKWDDAIHSFRAAIKFDVNCIIYWESLGDAYAARGSYHSAIRVFQKIREMNPTNIYANLQLALLKTTLRMYPDAIIEFESLLREHPRYLPGLKGAAEAHLGLAHNMKLDHRYRCCKSHLQNALNYLQNAFLMKNNKEMVWLWRLAGCILMRTALMPNSMANLEVSGKLVKSDADSKVVLQRNELLRLATRFYCCAVKLKQNTYLWYELALCYYHASKYMSNDVKSQIELAEKACKMAIQAQNDRWQNWNLLGVINMHKEHVNIEFAQHCFVQALNIERKSYTTWTNLGVLYLLLSEIKLANQAFKRAQQSSPIYGKAWIGQAMIAEAISEDEEALDLFRHCLQFEYHPESAIGYAHWICKELSNENKINNYQYRHAIESMFADVVALDAINWYTVNEEDDSSVSGLSFQAFLNIRQKLYRPAVKSYKLAIEKATPGAQRDKMLTNLGYLYLMLNEPNEAVNVFHMVAEATFKPIIGLAIAYFRSEQHQDSYMVFSSVLKSLDGSDDHKAACIIVAMSAMLYASQGQEDTKSMLMQCLPLKDAPIQAVYSAFALGTLHQDNELTESLLVELHRNESFEKYCPDIAYLIAQYHLSKNNKQAGLNYILSRVHIYPYSTNLRRVLADYLSENFSNEDRYRLPTSQIALSAIDLSHRDDVKKNDCETDAQCLIIASRALKSIDRNRSMKLIQRAVHLNPKNRQAWSVLMSE